MLPIILTQIKKKKNFGAEQKSKSNAMKTIRPQTFDLRYFKK